MSKKPLKSVGNRNFPLPGAGNGKAFRVPGKGAPGGKGGLICLKSDSLQTGASDLALSRKALCAIMILLTEIPFFGSFFGHGKCDKKKSKSLEQSKQL